MIAPCVVGVVLHSHASLETHATVFLEHLEDCCTHLVFFLFRLKRREFCDACDALLI